MRIPGGDLVPTRNRRYGGSYGRRRRNRRRGLALVLLLVAVGAAAAWYLRRDDAGVPARVGALPSCAPSVAPTAAAPAPRPVALRPVPPAKVTLSVLNGTNRPLLAKRVADLLAADGFHVTRQGNARAAVVGASQVVYGPYAGAQALTASLWVPGSVVVAAPKERPGSVQLVLGSGFIRLATPGEAAAAARAAATATASPTPSAAASVLPCRP